MVLGLTVHFMIVNSSVPENKQHLNANICLQTKRIEYPMFQNQTIDTKIGPNVFVFNEKQFRVGRKKVGSGDRNQTFFYFA